MTHCLYCDYEVVRRYDAARGVMVVTEITNGETRTREL